ncbi:hypothetical protein AB1K70_05955 [Bremerella sp. JC770]|uniref:hypothetical protein n=1 Tax=Bremerella sp. JC770 TaxID=3232137 RepID=UPI00345A1F47
MVRFRFIFLVSCLASSFAIATAEAQVAPKTQYVVAAWQPSLVTTASLLLGNQPAGETILDERDAATWIQAGELPSYQEMNRRALRLRSCRVYLCSARASSLGDSFWRERFANYGIHLVEISDKVSKADLIYLSEELSRLFPEKKEVIQENLYLELERRSAGQVQVNLAIHQPE